MIEKLLQQRLRRVREESRSNVTIINSLLRHKANKNVKHAMLRQSHNNAEDKMKSNNVPTFNNLLRQIILWTIIEIHKFCLELRPSND